MSTSVSETFAFEPTQGAPFNARHQVADTLRSWGCTQHVDEVVLAVDELVTNVLLHAAAPIRLTLYASGEDKVWVEVHDDGTGMITTRPDDLEALSGRGLHIVEQISSSWGVVEERQGKSVWFEVGSPEPSPTPN